MNQPVNRTRDRVARTAILVLVLALLAFWAWAFVIYEPPGNPDRLEDRAWPTAAEQRCARAVGAIGDLPAASQSPSPGHRADVIDEATEILDQLADDLAVLPGGTDDDRVLVGKWLDDWAVYLGDRATHGQRHGELPRPRRPLGPAAGHRVPQVVEATQGGVGQAHEPRVGTECAQVTAIDPAQRFGLVVAHRHGA